MAKTGKITALTAEQAKDRMNMPVWRIRQLAKTDPTFPTLWYGKRTLRIVAEGIPAWQMAQQGNFKV